MEPESHALREKGSEGGWEGCGPSFVSGLSPISGEELRTMNSIKDDPSGPLPQDPVPQLSKPPWPPSSRAARRRGPATRANHGLP